MHVGIANMRWRGKRSRHSRRMRNPQFYVSGKRPMEVFPWDTTTRESFVSILGKLLRNMNFDYNAWKHKSVMYILLFLRLLWHLAPLFENVLILHWYAWYFLNKYVTVLFRYIYIHVINNVSILSSNVTSLYIHLYVNKCQRCHSDEIWLTSLDSYSVVVVFQKDICLFSFSSPEVQWVFILLVF